MPSNVWGEITYPLPNFNGCSVGASGCLLGLVQCLICYVRNLHAASKSITQRLSVRYARHKITSYMTTSRYGNAFRITGLWWGKSSGHLRIPLTKDQQCLRLTSLCCLSEQAVEQTVQLTMIWDAITLMWGHCNVTFDAASIVTALV